MKPICNYPGSIKILIESINRNRKSRLTNYEGTVQAHSPQFLLRYKTLTIQLNSAQSGNYFNQSVQLRLDLSFHKQQLSCFVYI